MEDNKLDFSINLEQDNDTEASKQTKAPEGPIPINSQRTETPNSSTNSACAIFSIDYWKGYFDVTEEEVMTKLTSSIHPMSNVFQEKIDAKVDLYGPVWISISLTVLLIVCRDFLVSIFSILTGRNAGEFNVGKVGFTFTLIFGALFLFTMMMFGLLKYFGGKTDFFKIGAIYGYSYTCFVILTAISTLLRFRLLVFILTVVTTAQSIMVILKACRSLIDPIQDNSKKLLVAQIIGAYQIIFALITFMFLL